MKKWDLLVIDANSGTILKYIGPPSTLVGGQSDLEMSALLTSTGYLFMNVIYKKGTTYYEIHKYNINNIQSELNYDIIVSLLFAAGSLYEPKALLYHESA
jgi:hypothetical protein